MAEARKQDARITSNTGSVSKEDVWQQLGENTPKGGCPQQGRGSIYSLGSAEALRHRREGLLLGGDDWRDAQGRCYVHAGAGSPLWLWIYAGGIEVRVWYLGHSQPRDPCLPSFAHRTADLEAVTTEPFVCFISSKIQCVCISPLAPSMMYQGPTFLSMGFFVIIALKHSPT